VDVALECKLKRRTGSVTESFSTQKGRKSLGLSEENEAVDVGDLCN